MYGCSNDNPVSKKKSFNPTYDTLTLFSKDSINIFTTDTAQVISDTLNYVCNSNIGTIHVSFEVVSHSSYCRFYVRVLELVYNYSFQSGSIDTFFVYQLPVNNTIPSHTQLILQNWNYNNPSFASMRNIKLWTLVEIIP